MYAEKAGIITAMDTRALGMSVVTLGGGRRKATDPIDYSVGLSDIAALGTSVDNQTPLAIIHANSEKSWEEAAKRCVQPWLLVIKNQKRRQWFIAKLVNN